MAEALERLALARSAVEQSCHLLLTPSPEILDRSAAALSRAIEELAAGRALIPPFPSDSGVLAEVREIQAKAHLAGRLLENAATYHSRWNRILRSMVAGYTADGAAASIAAPGRLRVEG